MAALYQVRYTLCGVPWWTRRDLGPYAVYYERVDGSHLDVEWQLVWCRGCRGFRDGELIETIEELDRRVYEARHGESLIGEDVLFNRLWIACLEQRREWRAGRQSPPKCLSCGSTDVAEIPWDAKVPNPCGPGKIEISLIGFAEVSIFPRFYTAEGDRIPRDQAGTVAAYERLIVRRHGLFACAFPFEVDDDLKEEENPWNS